MFHQKASKNYRPELVFFPIFSEVTSDPMQVVIISQDSTHIPNCLDLNFWKSLMWNGYNLPELVFFLSFQRQQVSQLKFSLM